MLEYGTPKEVLGLNNQMTLILQQLLQTHPAPAYHRKREIDVSFFDTNLNSSVRVVRDNLGKVTSKKILLEEEIGKVFDFDVVLFECKITSNSAFQQIYLITL